MTLIHCFSNFLILPLTPASITISSATPPHPIAESSFPPGPGQEPTHIIHRIFAYPTAGVILSTLVSFSFIV